jgi:antitoxin component of MazEF toxin-antitoxin module
MVSTKTVLGAATGVLWLSTALAQYMPPVGNTGNVPNPSQTAQTIQAMQQIQLMKAQQAQIELQNQQIAMENQRQREATDRAAADSAAGRATAPMQADSAADVHALPGPNQAERQARGEKFMRAIQYRRYRWADFDKVVFNTDWPVSPDMVALMAESPYAADMAYYLAKHPNESADIARMPLPRAGAAMREVEARLVSAKPAN